MGSTKLASLACVLVLLAWFTDTSSAQSTVNVSTALPAGTNCSSVRTRK